MATHKTARRTTAKARPGCQCPLCAGTVATANGVYPCRASTWIEYVIVVDGEYLGTRATEMSAKSELASYRRDLLTRPIEQAAAEADIEAEVAAFVAEVAAAQSTIRPALLPLAYKPAIYPTPDGYTFEGAGRCYLSNIDADLARTEMMANA